MGQHWFYLTKKLQPHPYLLYHPLHLLVLKLLLSLLQKNVAKYQGYISTKPSTTPDMITYICTRCNTHFKKESSLLRHNKRFHPEFDQTVKGKKRESNEGITHGVRKITKLNGQKRKRILNSTPNKRFLPYIKST